ncbi:MAG: 4Fe-4S binding domain protein [candidate division TM6 bacterium GW2011_GWF2_32_72]|nr:MAG: 4Fe-4S binding domain protein [candidate division TM6 bacterium GW2011_GWF2_32_72]
MLEVYQFCLIFTERDFMAKVKIEPGCIGCGACQFFAPDVFEVDNVSKVKENADLEKNSEQIKKAVNACPVGVIKYEE